MPFFAKIKGAKKAADKHKQSKAQEIPVEKVDTPVPYRHVPTHAAVDALTGAPSSWREEDRAAIKHQHKRRSMMTRNSSALSGTLHPSSSYTGSDFSSYGMTAAASSSRPSPTRLDTRRSYQGQGHYQPSPLGSSGVSPTGSEHSTSSSSSQLIELPNVVTAPKPQQHGQHLSPLDNAPRSTTRKLGEAPLFDTPPPRIMPVKASTTAPAPVNPKKRSWGFMKRNSQAPAIAAH
ncbi:MAG: hypothetical protein LQ338_007581 [Usnochroma carphineum]|nr:MAG: hypothetical protein LQ338_007581 [Usnochroma carphineum]